MLRELWPHLGSDNSTSGFQYFTLLVWRNDSAFEKYRIYFYLYDTSFSAMALLFFFTVYFVNIKQEDSFHLPQFLCLVQLQCVWTEFWAVNWVQMIVSVQKQAASGGRKAAGLGARDRTTFECFQSMRVMEFQIRRVCVSLQRGGCGLQCSNTLFIPQLWLQRRCSEQMQSFVR